MKNFLSQFTNPKFSMEKLEPELYFLGLQAQDHKLLYDHKKKPHQINSYYQL